MNDDLIKKDAEIERLKRVVDGLETLSLQRDREYLVEIERLTAENTRLREACASGWGEPTLINQLKQEVESLTEERDAFHMDYRMQCDAETKALVVERDAARTISVALAEEGDALREDASAAQTALRRICALHPETDSDEGYNEWGEADCFRQAQVIAQKARTQP